MVKKEDHDRVKMRLYYKKIRICPFEPLRQELQSLRIINAKKVDHPKGGSKDIADALANAVWALESKLTRRTVPLNIVEVF